MTTHLHVTQDSGRALVMRGLIGPVHMLNLLRFREVADYSSAPELSPCQPISGAEAYHLYLEATVPHLCASGGELLFLGDGGHFLIGPGDERWDMAMLVRQQSVDAFIAFATDEAYLAGIGHRNAALQDSRLLPLMGMPLPLFRFLGRPPGATAGLALRRVSKKARGLNRGMTGGRYGDCSGTACSVWCRRLAIKP